jgi:UDP-N-acetylmuramate--alanine ligase
VVGVGRDARSDLQMRGLAASGPTTTYDVWAGDERRGTVELQVPGLHYAVDSLAALAAGLQLGFGFDELSAGLGGFLGSGRRMELKGEVSGVRVFDSYAHHPSEIAADLQAARALAGAGRLVVCFQPHLYSRTRFFGAQMGRALSGADVVVVMDVYGAREPPEPGVDGSLVSDAVMLAPDDVVFEPVWSAAAAQVVRRTRRGDLVLTLGAGDVTEIGPQILALLADSDADAEGDHAP